jgi:hypothetical protein
MPRPAATPPPGPIAFWLYAPEPKFLVLHHGGCPKRQRPILRRRWPRWDSAGGSKVAAGKWRGPMTWEQVEKLAPGSFAECSICRPFSVAPAWPAGRWT